MRKTIIHDVIAQLVELPIFERGNIGETRVVVGSNPAGINYLPKIYIIPLSYYPAIGTVFKTVRSGSNQIYQGSTPCRGAK